MESYSQSALSCKLPVCCQKEAPGCHSSDTLCPQCCTWIGCCLQGWRQQHKQAAAFMQAPVDRLHLAWPAHSTAVAAGQIPQTLSLCHRWQTQAAVLQGGKVL